MARIEARVEQIDPGGMALVAGGSRFWVNWPLLGLSDVRTTGTSASLRWRVHCIDPGSRPGDYHAGWQNSSSLRAAKGNRIMPASMSLRTGVLELDFQLETCSGFFKCFSALQAVTLKLFPESGTSTNMY